MEGLSVMKKNKPVTHVDLGDSQLNDAERNEPDPSTHPKLPFIGSSETGRSNLQ